MLKNILIFTFFGVIFVAAQPIVNKNDAATTSDVSNEVQEYEEKVRGYALATNEFEKTLARKIREIDEKYKNFVKEIRIKYDRQMYEAYQKYNSNKNVESYKEYVESTRNKLIDEIADGYTAYKREREALLQKREDYYLSLITDAQDKL